MLGFLDTTRYLVRDRVMLRWSPSLRSRSGSNHQPVTRPDTHEGAPTPDGSVQDGGRRARRGGPVTPAQGGAR
jgi:hypothetical protein